MPPSRLGELKEELGYGSQNSEEEPCRVGNQSPRRGCRQAVAKWLLPRLGEGSGQPEEPKADRTPAFQSSSRAPTGGSQQTDSQKRRKC